jgi:hypothetical protein
VAVALVERDFVMRIVKQLAELLARALKLKREQRYDEAAQTLEGGCADLLGLDFAALALVDSASCAQLLGEPLRIRTFAALLEELAEVHRLDGDEAKARARSRHAFEMYCEVLARKSDDAESLAGLERLRPRVDTAALPQRYAAR